MPNWQPNWEDVQFDHAAAQAAVTECNLAAGSLDNALTGLSGAVSTLTTDGRWDGAYQVEYHVAQENLRRDFPTTRAALAELAADITTAATNARNEQTHRESERDRWRQEKATEDRARAERQRHRNIPI
jgi:uncharacterized protein YukE